MMTPVLPYTWRSQEVSHDKQTEKLYKLIARYNPFEMTCVSGQECISPSLELNQILIPQSQRVKGSSQNLVLGRNVTMLLAFIRHVFHFLSCILFLKSGVEKLTEWSMVPACLSLMCFFNRGNFQREYFFKNFVSRLCTFCYICKFVSGLTLWFLGNFWFNDLCEE